LLGKTSPESAFTPDSPSKNPEQDIDNDVG